MRLDTKILVPTNPSVVPIKNTHLLGNNTWVSGCECRDESSVTNPSVAPDSAGRELYDHPTPGTAERPTASPLVRAPVLPRGGRSAAAWFICATQKNLALTQGLLTQGLLPVGRLLPGAVFCFGGHDRSVRRHGSGRLWRSLWRTWVSRGGDWVRD